MQFIKDALENSADDNLKKKMNLVKNVFLTNRQAGECEIYYKLFPFLNLSHSNIGTIFLPTGFKRNRSRFLKQITEEEANFYEDAIEVEGKEGNHYVEKSSLMDKYMERLIGYTIGKGIETTNIDKLCFSQFAKRYEPTRSVPKSVMKAHKKYADVNENSDSDIDSINSESPNKEIDINSDSDYQDDNEDDIEDDNKDDNQKIPKISTIKLTKKEKKDYIIEKVEDDKLKKLPKYIALTGKRPGDHKWMRLRTERAIRFHKFKKTNDAHQYYYSQMQLYLPFSSEDKLFPDDDDQCKALYNKNKEKIDYVMEHVMEHFKAVSEAKDKAEELISNIGLELDANKEQEEDESREEGEREHPELVVKDPTGMMNEEPTLFTGDRTFRKIEIQTDDELFAKIRTLDIDQRLVFDKVLNYADSFMAAKKNKGNNWPTPPLLFVHGGAGTGKSHVIDVTSQMLDKTFRTPGDDPNCPYVLKLAFTGNAASIIKGQTLHSAFQFPFGNNLISLSDKTRDLRRKQLQNLRVLLIDEVSLIKSDLLYQLYFRLQKDIFQNSLDFGNVAVIFLGDLAQIKPPMARHVFQSPSNPKSKLLHDVDNLWHKFEVITLKTNHRQGEDREYADLLNRIRVAKVQPSEEDIDVLKTRVFPRDSNALPDDALLVSGTNKIVNKVNEYKLNKLPGELIELKAAVYSNTRGSFKPKIDNAGMIKGTTLKFNLLLKKGCRVMLSHNLDVCDGLTNGAMGTAVDFKRDPKGKIKFVLVKFDNEDCGRERRKQLNFDHEYPGQAVTAIELLEFDFTIKEGSSATATAVNFPLRLCYASTSHKVQGHSIKKPNTLILDLQCWLEPGMCYVMFSRVQCLNQLYILDTLPESKIKAWPEALEELDRLDSLDVSKQVMSSSALKIVSQNTRSLNTHFIDILADFQLMSSEVICIQETWEQRDQNPEEHYQITGKHCHFNSIGRGAGIVTYFTPDFNFLRDITEDRYQMTSISSELLMIINIYRSTNAENPSFLSHLNELLDGSSTSTVICGDLNFCQRDEINHPVYKFLLDKNFIPAQNPPIATRNGRCLDQIWTRLREDVKFKNTAVQKSYYSDHSKVFLTVVS